MGGRLAEKPPVPISIFNPQVSIAFKDLCSSNVWEGGADSWRRSKEKIRFDKNSGLGGRIKVKGIWPGDTYSAINSRGARREGWGKEQVCFV